MLRRLFPLALALVASPVAAQVTATLPVTCNASGTVCTPATPVTNPDGTNIGAGGGTPTGSAGAPNAAVVTVQGVSGGTVVPVSAASLPLPTGAATETTLAAASAKLPASLGAKTGATSLSVVPASDGFVVTSSSLVPGVAATSLGKAEDAVAATGDTGVFTLGVRRDTLTVSASANGDYNEIATDKYGSQQVKGYEKQARTFSASANITVAASATDIAILPGSASGTVFITKVIISGIQTTTGQVNVSLIKRSAADSGGTSTAMAAIPHDSADSAAGAAPLSYTANPTPGTAVGTVRQVYVPVVVSTAITQAVTVLEFGDKGKPIILNGVAQGLAVNLNGATLAGGVINVTFEWFEI